MVKQNARVSRNQGKIAIQGVRLIELNVNLIDF